MEPAASSSSTQTPPPTLASRRPNLPTIQFAGKRNPPPPLHMECISPPIKESRSWVAGKDIPHPFTEEFFTRSQEFYFFTDFLTAHFEEESCISKMEKLLERRSGVTLEDLYGVLFQDIRFKTLYENPDFVRLYTAMLGKCKILNHWIFHRNSYYGLLINIAVEAKLPDSLFLPILEGTNAVYIDVPNSYAETPLQTACRFRSIRLMNHLLNAGANPNCTTTYISLYLEKFPLKEALKGDPGMETTPLTEVVSLLEQHNLDPNAGEGVSKLFLDRLIPLTVRDPSPEDLEVIVLLLKTFDLSNNFDTLYHVRGYPQGVSIRALIPSVVAKISLVTQCTVTLNDQEITVSVFTKLSAFRNLVITEVNRKTVQKPDTYIADYGIVPGQKIPLVAISRAD